MNRSHRIWAVVGLVLIAISLLSMMVGFFAETLRALMFNVSLTSFIVALGVLVVLSAIRKRNEQGYDDQEPKA